MGKRERVVFWLAILFVADKQKANENMYGFRYLIIAEFSGRLVVLHRLASFPKWLVYLLQARSRKFQGGGEALNAARRGFCCSVLAQSFSVALFQACLPSARNMNSQGGSGSV